MAQSHVTYHLIPTPFTLIFNSLKRALNWAQKRQQRFLEHDFDLVEIDIYNVPAGTLWDAYQIFRHLNFPANRMDYHKNEYLYQGTIEPQRIMAVLPIGGAQVSIPVPLGELRFPQVLIDMMNSEDEEAVGDTISEENHRTSWEYGFLFIPALCSARFDAAGE